jgi:hypothetical protein
VREFKSQKLPASVTDADITACESAVRAAFEDVLGFAVASTSVTETVDGNRHAGDHGTRRQSDGRYRLLNLR